MTPAAPVAPPPKLINLIVGLIRDYMSLDRDQVVLYNQKWKIPADSRLYISVGMLAIKFYAPCTAHEPCDEGLKEIVSVNSQETYSINVMSRSQEALERNNEVIMAFNSTMGQQLCDAQSVKLARLPLGMNNISQVEGTAILNRFVCTITALCARSQERIVQYYDKFQTTELVINP